MFVAYRSVVNISVCGHVHKWRFYSRIMQHLHEEEYRQAKYLAGLPIVHHEKYVCPLPPNHRFKMMKFHYLYEILLRDGVIKKDKQVILPQKVSRELASAAHSQLYVDKFFDGETSAAEQRVTGFVWTPGLASRVRYETGGTCLAAKLSLECGLACSTGGGTHHAYPDHGSGYCLINDLAVAAYHLLQSGMVDKVLIVDLDVHQGDGTAAIFQDQPDVFTLSFHCQNNFPLRKQKSDLDVGLAVGTNDKEYLNTLAKYLPDIMDSFRPDIILYDAGVDPHEKDELGKLKLSDDGLYLRDTFVLREAVCRGIPVTTVIGGGYDEIMRLSARHTIIHRVAQQMWNTYL
ncbi:uncharacterized protein SYNPCC7002_A1628-like isoform X1 [Portunus trituberculatus]|uniref:uncharacterized protein SYNPCC7002_A1628-like isoform X1 n=1 Tax=Portunus trituberculatus TaxID=210409 RepID=UPI001E1D141B|nr:uncharacterized protein SYNPCC7002_A1628-like isoform X1 [Portunus trituberculatus]